MTLLIGPTQINRALLGSTEIKRAYLGSSLIHDKTSAAAAISFIGSDIGSSNSSGAISLPLISGVQQGDLLLHFNGYRGLDTGGIPTGFTSLGTVISSNAGTHYCDVSYQFAGASPPDPIKASTETGYKPHLAILTAFRGVSAVAMTADPDGDNGTSTVTPDITASVGSVILDLAIAWAVSITPQGGFATLENGLTDNPRAALTMTPTVASDGARTGQTFNFSGSSNCGSATLELFA